MAKPSGKAASSWSQLLPPGSRLTFAAFMELALYHEHLGYYCRSARPFPAGPAGDFVTAPSLGPVFAGVLASALASLSQAVGQPLTFLDLGAGEGSLLRGLAQSFQEGLFRRAVAVERSPAGRQRLAAMCPWAEVVCALADAAPAEGPAVVVASEFYDAQPCHLVEQGPQGLEELYVTVDREGRLSWAKGAPSTPALASYLAKHGVALEVGQRAELRPQVEGLHRQLLAWAGREALVLVVDYGYPAGRLYNAKARRGGSLVGYRQHQLVREVLQAPGEVDITAHVNWDDLLAAAGGLGFQSRAPEPLALFLVRMGVLRAFPSKQEGSLPWEVKALLNPAGMGSELKVLAQGKGRIWEAFLQLVDGWRA